MRFLSIFIDGSIFGSTNGCKGSCGPELNCHSLFPTGSLSGLNTITQPTITQFSFGEMIPCMDNRLGHLEMFPGSVNLVVAYGAPLDST